jgi:hypothetical protein
MKSPKQIYRDVYRKVTRHNTAGETAENMAILAESDRKVALHRLYLESRGKYGEAADGLRVEGWPEDDNDGA